LRLKSNPEFLAYMNQVSLSLFAYVIAPGNIGPGSYSKKAYSSKKEILEKPQWGND